MGCERADLPGGGQALGPPEGVIAPYAHRPVRSTHHQQPSLCSAVTIGSKFWRVGTCLLSCWTWQAGADLLSFCTLRVLKGAL